MASPAAAAAAITPTRRVDDLNGLVPHDERRRSHRVIASSLDV
jgi:hypothetical protein